ncbi:peptidylprolyl isomerase [Calothrix sp. NIES-2098]|uniref:peptidylprolyl isomerase n=1 Tax=Calothrix sp. NIES-2098 TaxID=1954171 RepID=UPI000BBC6638
MIDFKGHIIFPEEIITYLKKTMQLKELCNHLLSQKIIDKAAEERGITLTPEEIQAEADRLRYENRLVKASDTLAWLADQLIVSDDWEAGIRDKLLSKKLSETLFDKDVEKYFSENQLDYDQVVLYQIVVPYVQLAQEICYQIEEGELSFYEAAHIYDIDEKRRITCGYEGKFYRWSLKPDIAAVVFSARPGDLLGPLIIDQASYILMVEEFIPAELTPARHKEILNKMFKEWLAAELNYLLNA